MKASELKKRLERDRPSSMISIRIPDDVVADMERIAPFLGFSDCQSLMRHYIGQGLRVDQERLAHVNMHAFIKSLKKHGIHETVISMAMEEVSQVAPHPD